MNEPNEPATDPVVGTQARGEISRFKKAFTKREASFFNSGTPAESLPVPHDILQTAYITRKGEPMRPSDDTQEKPEDVYKRQTLYRLTPLAHVAWKSQKRTCKLLRNMLYFSI